MIYETKYETKNGITTVVRQDSNKPKTAKPGAAAGASSAASTSEENK